ncbi:MAG: N-acetyl-gamma-glutamyl-phosphate reductase, partial [Betaproteobacteria bacterium]|nr:N-acetyl-gamma-glutamyl-phosphate reductase [Betaproteobacteria bacterium]
MTYKVFVDGQEGTTGLQINEYLAQRSDVEVLRIEADKRKDLAERKRLINASDVTFLCLPDEAAKESVSLVDNPHTCVIDASTAHRVNPAWTFGLPELAKDQRAKIKTSKRIANPGCHATAFILALRPLVQAGLLPAATQIAANSITGYSGGGKSMIADYQAASNDTARLKAP